MPNAIQSIVRLDDDKITQQQSSRLAEYYRSIAPALDGPRKELAETKKRLAEIKPQTTVPVMRQLPENKKRVTKVQIRGNYLSTGDEVREGTPAAFHSLPADAATNRLSLAKWLVDENNPLTARVIANRHWEQIFGLGIVSTSEEFGSQGELPTHPQLLDWLAVELQQSGWDLKRFLKLLVTSATYRQSSAVTAEQLEADPFNRLLARGPRFRVSAEIGARSGAESLRLAERQNVRPAGQAASAELGAESRIRFGDRLEDKCRRRSIPPRPVYDLATIKSLSFDGTVRRAESRSLYRQTDSYQHAATGPGHHERSRLRRSGSNAGA